MNTKWKIITLVAGQELKINIRNRWTLVFAIIFGLLVLGISYFGMSTTGYASFQDFTRTTVSLLNLILYVVPMISILMGILSFVGEKSAPELLFAQPIERSSIILGKLLGLLFSIAISTLCGFGISGIFIAIDAGMEGFARYLGMVFLAILLSLVFLSLATLIAILCHRQFKAFGIAFFAWFFFVLFYDLLVFGGILFLEGKAAKIFLFLSLFGNPVDMIRVSGLILIGGASIFGASGATLIRFLGGTAGSIVLFSAIFFLWIALPIWLSSWLIQKEDIS